MISSDAALRTLLATFFVFACAALAGAEDYPCPSDPGFCYLDVANDGCFDGGTDTGPIDADLEAGIYPPGGGAPPPGSIVCPPSVRRLKLTTDGDWTTAAGGHILIYAAKISQKSDTDSLEMHSGGRLLLQGRATAKRNVRLFAVGDIAIEGRLGSSQYQVTVESTGGGNIDIARRSNFKGDSVFIRSVGGGDITLGDRVKFRTKINNATLETTGAITAEDLKVVGGGCSISGGTTTLAGRTLIAIPTFDDGGGLWITGTTTADIEELHATAPYFGFTGGDLAIGLPGALGVVRPSKVRTKKSSFIVGATGTIRLDQIKITTAKIASTIPRGLDVSATGALVEILNCDMKGGKFEIDAAAATCDISGTTWDTENPEVFDCDTLIGP